MKLSIDDVKWVHVEASSKCNAWCPACSRNNSGFGLVPGLVEQDLTPARMEEIVSSLPNLYGIQLCGNFGDPLASAYIDQLIEISKRSAKKIQIHTNGSLRSTAWWAELAKKLADIDHEVWFGIDGLAGVHEIYRQGTSFKKIINNAQAFIDHNGQAVWQFIPYKHNEHQVKACIKMSQQMRFKRFHLAKLYRKQTIARHYKTGHEFDLLPTESMKALINIDRVKQQVEIKNCMHLSMPSIYVSADGSVSRCCYLANNEKFQNVEQLLNNVSTNLLDDKCIKSCG
jgi:organic radical activating enzyme